MMCNGEREGPSDFAAQQTWFQVTTQTLPSDSSDWTILGQSAIYEMLIISTLQDQFKD
jgi:hypothetical protein